MARKIDEEKLARIKQATMKTIVDHGIEKATIAMIAKNANVSGGYLYRLYSGKQALIDELYFDKIDSLIGELEFLINLKHTSIAPIIKIFVQNRFVFAINETEASNFFYQLLHNDNFVIPNALKDKSIALMQQLLNIGKKSGEIGKNVGILDLSYHILTYAIDYVHYKKNNFLGIEEIDENNNNVNYITNNILNILKQDN
ncbi:TetR/AcrR family transcriptional regulator [Lutibacter sp. A80]|uniref:TetR/AcrR family transcriptional regulator n=1 Tax=Lutibacter sp. A80 TaxID=2918453 RepID=UPI001F05173F|nr:TetR/AcrR family transcriptional regulator [Lutibacter sp. A80]UMB61839.1 TetR/AcrR family transcriptional regulator [Lutibacter sp. A80]